MKNIRFVLSVAILVFLVAGYGASQYAALFGDPVGYASKIDSPPVMWLALFFLIICIVFAFIRDPEADGK